MNKTRRNIRLPVQTIDTLRQLSNSFINPRPLPDLVRRCLKQTEGLVVHEEETQKYYKCKTMPLTVFLDEEHAALDHSEIVQRVHNALEGIEHKLDTYQLHLNTVDHPEFIVDHSS